MTPTLSDQTRELLDACFADEEQREQVATTLQAEALSDERIAFSVIRLIVEHHDNKDYIDVAVDLARADWRDLLMAAGHGTDLNGHSRWAAATIRARPRVVINEPASKHTSVDGDGWVDCPTCGSRFKLSDSNAWDGTRHRRCLQRLDTADLAQARRDDECR
jgi:hypothetical protein